MSDDDWETDATYDNKLTENEQRWGKDVGQSRNAAIDMRKLIEETEKADDDMKKKGLEESGITGSKGYGGKFGVEKDRMDQSALGHDYIGKVEKHASQKDYSDGFGGKFGIQTDRVDKSAVGFDYKSQLTKHESQTDHSKGFGGKFGVDDRMDKSAIGFQADVGKVGTNYAKIKPDISGAKPSNFRNKFENFAIHSEEEGKERAAEQKRIRQEKDLLDREQSVKEQSTAASNEPSQNFKPQRSAVVTGRNERISDVINVFNTPQTVEEKPAPKQPIKIPKAEAPKVVHVQTPDIISSSEILTHKEPPKFAEVHEPQRFVETQEPQRFAEVHEPPRAPKIQEPPRAVEDREPQIVQAAVVTPEIDEAPPANTNDAKNVAEMEKSEQELIEQLKSDNHDEVAEEQFILSPENPGIVAFALYDYQAAADDEISFDPGDQITHIEMIDEGWWKGFHQATVTYGLFPANYVQLRE